MVGAGIAWFYINLYIIKPLKERNKNLRKIEVRKISTDMGDITARVSEWPLNLDEYWDEVILRECIYIQELGDERIKHHINAFAQHLLTRQKKDFMEQCKHIKHGSKILQQMD